MSLSVCARCEAKNPPGAATCQACGATLGGGTAVMASPGRAAPRPRVGFRVVRADGGPESLVAMRTDVLTCGKLGDIPLPDDPFVANTQARFFFSGSRLAVEDVGGGNGVFARLRQERDLGPGSELRVGRQRLVVEAIAAPAPGPDGALAFGSPDPGYRYRLVQMLEGGVVGAAFPLKHGENHLGRDQGDITFPGDGFVSGRHALVTVAPDRLRIKDLGSSNGTFLKLNAPVFVEQGDQFLVGRQLLKIELAAA